ncbi:hypothetical protein [Gemmatimonas sp.]|uniref:hypothetical protein n=1 Tax=Gemmatimonas sp. TaxID=1962908 RepID=UPI0026316C3A|nr:hypothetical protein [Gemmatimonas sp.]
MRILSTALLLLPSVAALPAQVAPRRPVVERGPLVITAQIHGRPVPANAYRVCVGTPRDLQAYGIAATDPSGSAQFPDAPELGDLLISIEAVLSSNVMYGASVTHAAVPTRRQITVDLAPNWMVRCPGATRRTVPGLLDSSGIDGTLQHTGTPVAVSRNLTFFTTTTSGVRTLGVTGLAREFRTRQDDLPFGEWRRATVTQGNQLAGVVHPITGPNGRKTVTLQLRNGRFGVSPMYTVNVDFVEIYFCNVRYQRADHALAPFGVPEGSLGAEDLRLTLGERKTFDTAWPSPNEKRRGYGMHLRTALNTGEHAIELTVRRVGTTEAVTIAPGVRQSFQADLVSARCP